MRQTYFLVLVALTGAAYALPAAATDAEEITAIVDNTGLDADTINDQIFSGVEEIQAQLENIVVPIELDQLLPVESVELLPYVALESAQFALERVAEIEPLVLAQLELSQMDREQLRREMGAAADNMQRAKEDMRRAQSELESSEAERERALMEARAEMEEAAREMARIGQEIAQGYVFQYGDTHRKAMLGINLGEEVDVGVHVAAVTPDGPADIAGVVAGDVLVSIDGQILEADDGGLATMKLVEHMTVVEPDQVVTLGVDRDGVHHDIVVTAAENDFRRFNFNFEFPDAEQFDGGNYAFVRPDDWAEEFRNGSTRFGPYSFLLGRPSNTGWDAMELVTLTPELGRYFGADEGLLVVRAPDSKTLQLEDGDVILKIDGRAPSSPGHALRILASYENGEQVEIEIMRDQRPVLLDVIFPDKAANPKT